MSQSTYIWRKLVTREWLAANEPKLHELTDGSYAVIERAGRRRLLVEVASPTARRLQAAFGGKSEKLARDWLSQMLRATNTEPIRVGNRLVITSDDTKHGDNTLVIPAGAAFGTGEHATTAMSLRLLERITRGRANGWRMFDAGTGSGILALAAKRFGAGEVIAIDHDTTAISTAQANARANGIADVRFEGGDATRPPRGSFDIFTANLYSELLIAALPVWREHLRRNARLILSGVMRTQEAALLRALRGNGFREIEIRRRGKWIAVLVCRKKRG